jgi:hypothetical protein
LWASLQKCKTLLTPWVKRNWLRSLAFLNKQSCLISLEDLLADKNQEFRWRFELGKPLVKPELVNKLPTKMRRFHDWYLKKLAEGLEMFGMLVRPGDFALQNEKVAWLRFADIYEIYHLDALNTDLMMAWCL